MQCRLGPTSPTNAGVYQAVGIDPKAVAGYKEHKIKERRKVADSVSYRPLF